MKPEDLIKIQEHDRYLETHEPTKEQSEENYKRLIQASSSEFEKLSKTNLINHVTSSAFIAAKLYSLLRPNAYTTFCECLVEWGHLTWPQVKEIDSHLWS